MVNKNPPPLPADFVNYRDGTDSTHVSKLEKDITNLFRNSFPGIPLEEQLQWNSDIVNDDSKNSKKGYPKTDLVLSFANNYPVYKLDKTPNPPGIIEKHEALFFVEPTLSKTKLDVYIARKIFDMFTVLNGVGGKNEIIKRAVQMSSYDLIQPSTDESSNFLFVVSPNVQSDDLEKIDSIRLELDKLLPFDFTITNIDGASGFKFIKDEIEILIAQLSIDDLVEISHLVYEKDNSKIPSTTIINRAFSDRIMWLLTKRKFNDNALLFDSSRPTSIGLTIFENDSSIGNIPKSANGIDVTISNVSGIKRHQLKMKHQDLAYMTTIPRTISEDSSLQRLPKFKKMSQIAQENIQINEPFPTPIIVVAEHKSIYLKNCAPKQLLGPLTNNQDITNPEPYSLNLVDGQHRVLSYYATNGSNPDFQLDVVLYLLPSNVTIYEKNTVMSKLFFDINFRSSQPDDSLYYTHCAKMTHDWPDGWQGKPKMWSARAHVTRFLLQLNSKAGYLKDYFQYHQIAKTGSGIKSTATYMAKIGFDFRYKNIKGANSRDKNALNWIRYMNVNSSGNYVTSNHSSAVFPDLSVQYSNFPKTQTFGPTPHQIAETGFYDLLATDFETFLEALDLGTGKYNLFQKYCASQSSVFSAIWKVFHNLLILDHPNLAPGHKLIFHPASCKKIGLVLKNLNSRTHSMQIKPGGPVVTAGFADLTGGGSVEVLYSTFKDAYNSGSPPVKLT
jgi:hypothetical protein